ncbi:lipopolysaccharide biosynthesis protein [Citrobacter freundii]|uniref:lipopolysaccharide biosynthesis protein n=1 Tax=Citrobacter freundii TaxID=546 RepID=UPI003989E948
MLREILNDGIYSLINKVFYFGAKTLAIILITHSLGASQGGQFIFLISIVEIIRVTCDFGVDVYVIKRYGEVVQKNKLLVTVFYQKMTSGILFYLMLVGYCILEEYDFSIYSPVSLALIFSLLFNLSNSYFQSLNQNRVLTPAITFASAIVISIFGFVWFSNIKLEPFVYLLVEMVFFCSVLYALSKKIVIKNINELWRYDFSSIIHLYRKTYNIGVTAIIVIIYSRLDNIYLRVFDPKNLAVYGQIFRMVDPLVMVSSVFSTVAYAKFCKFDLRKKEAKVMPFIFMMGSYVLFSSIGYYIFLVIIGERFALPTNYFQVLVLGFLCIAGIKCLNGALTAILQSQGLYRIGLYVAFVCILIAVPTMYFLIKKFQVLGAIYAIIFIESVSFILLAFSVFSLSNHRAFKT